MLTHSFQRQRIFWIFTLHFNYLEFYLNFLCHNIIIIMINKKKRKRQSSSAPTHCHNQQGQKMRDKIFYCTLIIFCVSIGATVEIFRSLLTVLNRRILSSSLAKLRKPRPKKSWSEETSRHSDRMFYRLFRMSRPCFKKLCQRIERAVGPKEFKSEAYIQDLKRKKFSTPESRMYHANLKTSGEWLCGEWKVAMALRTLAGGSYLDMYLWSNCNADYINRMTTTMLKNWFCNEDVISINFYDQVLYNRTDQRRIRSEFALKTDGVFDGCIGALDGWLVRIKCPTLKEVSNPGKYYSRKGFFGINVQVIVDKQKRVLWRYIGEKGSGKRLSSIQRVKVGKKSGTICRFFNDRGTLHCGRFSLCY